MKSMQYRTFGKTGEKVSILGLGTLRLPHPTSGERLGDSESAHIIRHAINSGINYIDTAYNYMNGESEALIGESLKGEYRQRVFLASKSPIWLIENSKDFDKFLDEQLRRLQTDYIDFYLLHGVDQKLWENKIERFQILSRMERAKKIGKIRHIGFSFHDEFSVFKRILNCGEDWEFCQIQLNYLDTEFQAGLIGLQEAALKNLGISIMEPLRGGTLVDPDLVPSELIRKNGRNPVEFALSYLWNQPGVSIVLSGMKTVQEIDENVFYASDMKGLTLQDQALMKEIKKNLHLLGIIPCTKCGYCQMCPANIPISDIFAIYNDYQKKKDYTRVCLMLNEYIKKKGTINLTCTECKYCIEHCPQKIPVMEMIKDACKLILECIS